MVARAVGREIRKRPVPASSSTTLAKITRSNDRRWVLIMWGSTTAPHIPEMLTCQRLARLSEATR